MQKNVFEIETPFGGGIGPTSILLHITFQKSDPHVYKTRFIFMVISIPLPMNARFIPFPKCKVG